MKHRSLLVSLLLGLLALSSVGLAYAESARPPLGRGDRRATLIEGEVTAIDGDVLTIETRHRGAIAVLTDANTRFRAKNNPDFALAHIRAGDTIAARGRLTDDGALSARVVLLIPAEVADKARGKVTAISGDSITVEDEDGIATDIVTSADTRIRIKGRPDATIDDVEVGMLVGAAGQFDAGGALRAKVVTAAEPRGPKGGPIEAGRVSEANGDAFVLSFPDGSALAVTTDAATVVILRGEEGAALGSLGDVTEGVVVVVMGLPSSDGSSIAARVILLGSGSRAPRPAGPGQADPNPAPGNTTLSPLGNPLRL